MCGRHDGCLGMAEGIIVAVAMGLEGDCGIVIGVERGSRATRAL